MIYQFRFPDIGEGIAEGEIVKWHVKPGEMVEEDQLIAEVQTDKAVVEITSPVKGLVKELGCAEGELIRVESVMITFETAGEDQAAVGRTVSAQQPDAQDGNGGGDSAAASASNAAAGRQPGNKAVLAAPVVRRLARELQVDLQQVTGTGKLGRITEEDVRRFAENRQAGFVPTPEVAAAAVHAPAVVGEEVGRKGAGSGEANGQASQAAMALRTPAASPDGGTMERQDLSGRGHAPDKEERIPLRGIRRSIAAHMAKSTSTAAHCTLMEEVDVSELVAIRKQMAGNAEQKGVRLTYLPFVIKAVVHALKAFPYVNASIDDEAGEIVLKKEFHIGVATDTEYGLIVPVVKHADQKSLLELAEEIARLAEKARSQKLQMDELTGSTFTVSNLGSTGVGLFGTPVINHPESAILAMHRIHKKPVVDENDAIVVRHVMGLSLSIDHRLIDGATGSYFLKRVIEYLEHPSLLFMEMV